MFKASNISLFMGGEFYIKNPPKNAQQLQEIFQGWADEIGTWAGDDLNKVTLSECEIVKNQIVVTLEDGISG